LEIGPVSEISVRGEMTMTVGTSSSFVGHMTF
jgi:hypothetical protein